MLSHLHVTPLEIGLVVIAIVALGVAFRLRQLRAQAYRRSILFRTPEGEEAATAPTARQWLARETAMNDLPPLREPDSHDTPRYDAPRYDTPRYDAPHYDPIPAPPGPAAAEERTSYAASDDRSSDFHGAEMHADDRRTHPADDTIVFPSTHGFVDYSNAELPPPRAPELPEPGAIATILSDGLDELASRGDTFADAVRAHPIRYVAGALATGFVAGLMFPFIYGQQRVARLLERVIESNEELKRVRYEEPRELPRPESSVRPESSLRPDSSNGAADRGAERRDPERFRQAG